MVSEKLRAAIKLGDTPAYRIAQRAGIDPTVLSKLICGIVKVKKGDPRVIAVGHVLNISPDECFRRDTN